MVLATLLACVVVLPVAPAHAAAADPVRERGVVTRVVDGDTVMFRPSGSTAEVSVRLAGIQAPELGRCGADVATARLRQLVEGRSVTLRSRVADSSSFGRRVRSVHLPLASGGAADINKLMLLEGMGFWFPVG